MNHYVSFILCCLVGGFAFAAILALAVCSICQLDVSNLALEELRAYFATGILLTGFILLVEDKR